MGDGCDCRYELMEAETKDGVVVFGPFLDDADTSVVETFDASGVGFLIEVGNDAPALFLVDDTDMGVFVPYGIETVDVLVIASAEQEDDEVAFGRVLGDRVLADVIVFGLVAVDEFVEGVKFWGAADEALVLEDGAVVDILEMFHILAPLGCVWIFVFRLYEKRRP
mgnify:CR=1 FL=1